MFESFTKPGWQHPKPEVRKAAIDELDDESILVELVHNDPAPEVRAHALSRVTTSEILDQLCESLAPPLQNQARAQRLGQLLPDPAQLASISDDAALVRIAGLCDDHDLVAAAIGRVQSLQTRMELAASHPLAKVRLCAAHGIDDIDKLKELMQLSKNKDKSVFRHCKELVDQHHAAEREAAEKAKQLQQLVEDTGNLATAAESPEFRARYLLLKDRWQPLLAHASAEQKQQVETDLEICARRLAEWAKAREAEQQQQEQVQEAQQSFGTLLAELEAIEPATVVLSETAAVKEFGKIAGRHRGTLGRGHADSPAFR